MSGEAVDTPVLIVGAGPAGLAHALCLARLGVPSVITERREAPSVHPRAHWVNTRTMELFQMWGMREALESEAFPSEHLHFALLEKLGGTSLRDRERFSPSVTLSVAQDIVEAGLLSALAEHRNLVTINRSHEFIALVDDGSSVAARFTTPAGDRTIRARYLVAADGASSPIRTALGIRMIGNPSLGSIINIYFRARLTPEGEKPMLGARSRSDAVAGSFISMNGRDRWCFHNHYDPREESAEDFTVERCRELVRTAAAVGPEVEIDVRSIRPWTMTALVAERMAQRNVFLIGDAAHAFPPSGGMGLNSGVQDAHNLAWKLAAVLGGHGGQALLDSYNAERRPVACLNTRQSFRNAVTGNLVGLRGEIDTDWARLAELEADEIKTVRSTAASIEDPEKRRQWEGVEHGGPLGQELGYTYDRSPVVVGGDCARPDLWIARYVPNACPGARAPHLFVTLPDGSRKSTIDLFDGWMTLVTWPEGQRWREQLLSSHEHKVRSIVIGRDWIVDEDDFGSQYSLAANGALLVRPDGFVAFSVQDDCEADRLPNLIAAAFGR